MASLKHCPGLFVIASLAAPLFAQQKQVEILAPYYETPNVVVDKMLALGGLKPAERMFDLGSGDGRIVIMAAKKYKADATGIEIDNSLVKASVRRIRNLGLSTTAHIISGDLLQQDYSSADLITVYLLPVANEKLIPIFERQLKPGTRIVSHNSALDPWAPLKTENIDDDGSGHSHRLYLYRR